MVESAQGKHFGTGNRVESPTGPFLATQHRQGTPNYFETPKQKTHLEQLKLHATDALALRECAIAQQRRVADDGRVRVAVLVREPLATG